MKIITQTGSYGITLAQARTYLRVDQDFTDEDQLISALVTASYEQVVAECNQFFVETYATMSIMSASGDIFITAQDVYNLSTGSLHKPNGITYAYFDTYYTGDISYTVAAGSSTVPPPVAIAQLMLVSNWYDNRQPMVIGASAKTLDFSVEALLSPYKIVSPGIDPPYRPMPFFPNEPMVGFPYPMY